MIHARFTVRCEIVDMQWRSIPRVLGLAILAVATTVGCGESEPSHSLGEDDLADFCPAALDWFDVRNERKRGEWGSSDAEWLASHEAESAALASLGPVVQPDFEDKYGNSLQEEYDEVLDDNESRLGAIAAGGGTRIGSSEQIIQINLRRNGASLNNFVGGVCRST